MNADEFPDSDEEYDLIPTDVYQATKNVAALTKVGESADQGKLLQLQKTAKKSSNSNGKILTANEDDFPSTEELESLELCEADAQVSSNTTPNQIASSSGEQTRKRTFDELFRDIQDLLQDDFSEELSNIDKRNDKKPRWDQPELVIEAIRRQRTKIQETCDHDATINNISTGPSQKSNSISLRIPQWNFVAITRCTDSQRLYVRVRPQRTFDTSKIKPTSGFLSMSYSQLKQEADKINRQNAERANQPLANTTEKSNGHDLWVDKYRPKTYMELLSDETVNRDFLRWLKLWDKVVFHRDIRKKRKHTKINKNEKSWKKPVEEETVDSRGFPIHRIALLCGPPGLGKTTLAHVVAKHAGYNVVEINASDDRGPEAFRQALLSSTQMQSMIGADPRPNCLVLDEIDGAPAASIDLLIKFVEGKLVAKGKKLKNVEKKNESCKRPIVCICNEAYTPSLRPLRTMAYIVYVSKVSVGRLVDRLKTITREENLDVSQGTLIRLAERSGCDIRSCLGALQFMGNDSEMNTMDLGSKDTKKGLFETMKDILQIPFEKTGPLPIRDRVQRVLHAVYNDSTDRLTEGIFENYPPNCHDKINIVALSLEWFQFYDKIKTTVMTKNDWRVMPYTNYAFVSWHLGFAGPKNPQLSYPHTATEVNQKMGKMLALVKGAQRSCGRDAETIILDIAPLLSELLTPHLRAVPINLYSKNEKIDLDRLINVMLDLGLTFVQERKEDGKLDYQLEPNLLEVGNFPEIKTRRGLGYTVKQIVFQALETERVKRASIASGIILDAPEVAKKSATYAAPKTYHAPNTTGPTVLVPEEKKCRDFFAGFKQKAKPIAQESSQPNSVKTSPKAEPPGKKIREMISKYGVWFKYKEGYSNAIRRTVQIKDFL